VNESRVVRTPDDLHSVFAADLVYAIALPATASALDLLGARIFGAVPTGPVLMTSASPVDFSWELVNHLIRGRAELGPANAVELVEPGSRAGDDPAALVLVPSLLEDDTRVRAAQPQPRSGVVLVRANSTTVADVDTVAHRLGAAGVTVRAAALVDGDRSRWRRWRRFTHTYGVQADPDRPWPIIDVLEEEKARTARAKGHPHPAN
jgi:hypothetical protein